MANPTIFTNNALSRMKAWHLSESTVLDAFNHGAVENATFGGRWNAVRKYPGFEIGVNYDQKQDGTYIIISVWYRGRM